MSNAPQTNAAFYCPAHQIRFHRPVAEVIECDRSAHALGAGFPTGSCWTYCCDCATFSPFEPLTHDDKLQECLVCERQTAKRYLCSNCQVMSIESAALVHRKSYSIGKNVIQPNCPGCAYSAVATAIEHDCEEVGTDFLTGRTVCPFCELELSSSAPASVAAQTKFCGACGTELTAPYRFCKRCGKPAAAVEDDVEPVSAENNITSDPLVDLDKTDPGFVDTGELSMNVGGAHVVNELDLDNTADINVMPAAVSWDFTAAQIPPKRRAVWVVSGVVALLSLVILVAVVSTSGNRKPNGKPPPTEQPGTSTIPVYAGMAYVPGGEFTMGSDTGDEYERPAHKVSVHAFYIDVNEVTCEQYLKFVTGKSQRWWPPGWTNGSYPPGMGKQPVTGVDWYDASAYAEWAGKRLPTEEEWEFAARGANGATYPWGTDWKPNAANAGDSTAHHLTDVGSYPQGETATGLMDVIGNAWEWTSSDLLAYPGGRFSLPVKRDTKVIRGGSWQETQQQATTTYRGFLRMSGADNYSATGFRCAKDANTVPSNSQTTTP